VIIILVTSFSKKCRDHYIGNEISQIHDLQSLQRALSGHPTPTRIGEWDEGSTEEVSPGGRGASRFIYFFEGLSKREGCFQRYLFFGGPFGDAGGRRHRARSFVWLAGTVSGPYPFGFVRTTDISRASAGPAWAWPTSADIFSAWTVYVPNSGCRPRQAAGALIVTLLVTFQGSASCP
jgi:hypothetical protein